MYPSQPMSDHLYLSGCDRRLQGPLSQPGPESEGVPSVEKGWVTYSGQEVWYVSCGPHPEIIKNLPKSKYTLCEILSMPWLCSGAALPGLRKNRRE